METPVLIKRNSGESAFDNPAEEEKKVEETEIINSNVTMTNSEV
jgi:hypothetical protein